MQFHLFPGLLVFIGSYLPLAIILAVQDIPVALVVALFLLSGEI
ncbi:hypothetical protein WJ970_33305 [Achromobacter xylosoxidans]